MIWLFFSLPLLALAFDNAPAMDPMIPTVRSALLSHLRITSWTVSTITLNTFTLIWKMFGLILKAFDLLGTVLSFIWMVSNYTWKRYISLASFCWVCPTGVSHISNHIPINFGWYRGIWLTVLVHHRCQFSFRERSARRTPITRSTGGFRSPSPLPWHEDVNRNYSSLLASSPISIQCDSTQKH